MAGNLQWPEWWNWELELSDHVVERMSARRFNEVDLRSMLDAAVGYREDYVEGRWAIHTRAEGKRWEVIVEPLDDERILMVVTAYRVV